METLLHLSYELGLMETHVPPPVGRNAKDLGLCAVDESCRSQGHTIARASIARSPRDHSTMTEICVDCTEAAGRLEGLRLWHNVCSCCFSTAFPDGLPTIERTHATTSHPSHHR